MRFIKYLAFLMIFISCREYPFEPIEEFECKAENFVGVWKYVATNNDAVLDSIPDITITLVDENHIRVDSLGRKKIDSIFSCQAGKDDQVFGGVVYELYSNDILLKHSRILFALNLTHKYIRE